MQKKDVVVIGGGIIGVSCAVELARKGANVTLIEKDKIGQGCSFGNAGWITPCFALPLPLPGMFFKSLKWLLDPEGPLYIKPMPSSLLLSWMVRFLRSMNLLQAERAIEALVEISKLSLSEYQKLHEKYSGKFNFEQKGLLMVGQSLEGVRSAVDEMNWVSKFEVPGREMKPDEIRAMEPSLNGHLEGGVFFPNEAHCDPFLLVETLKIEAQSLGVQIIEECTLLGAYIINGEIQSLRTTHGPLKADVYVLATGCWTRELGRELGLSIPLMGGKGYSMIIEPLMPQPQRPIMLVEKKIAITPQKNFQNNLQKNSLRIAGTLELVNQDFSISLKRVRAIIKGARQFLPIPEDVTEKSVDSSLWRGLRPCTPDGVPIIGWSPKIKNLMLATGHQMLGVQSGLGSARLVADKIEGKSSWIKTDVFSPKRF